VQLFFKQPEQWAQVLGAAIPQTSNFFLNYVITRAFMLNPVRLLMPREFTPSFAGWLDVCDRIFCTCRRNCICI
jgi:hypothetical protein